ncbi:MAG: hypothetical protein J6A77_08405 [Lachnospiraceae bacterium]|nr:hypothetical protein [Lachnospiraceae bacterium]
MSHLKKHWKKYLAGLAGLCLVLLLAGVIISHRVYLPGVNFWWRFCSMDDEMKFYWYDEETGECTGESVTVDLHLTGFDTKDTFLDDNENFLNGEIHVEGFDLGSEGTFASQSIITFDYDVFEDGCYRMIYGRALQTSDGKPDFGDSCVLYFLADNPELVQLYVYHTLEDGTTIEYMGYRGSSLEEAEANRDIFIHRTAEQ